MNDNKPANAAEAVLANAAGRRLEMRRAARASQIRPLPEDPPPKFVPAAEPMHNLNQHQKQFMVELLGASILFKELTAKWHLTAKQHHYAMLAWTWTRKFIQSIFVNCNEELRAQLLNLNERRTEEMTRVTVGQKDLDNITAVHLNIACTPYPCAFRQEFGDKASYKQCDGYKFFKRWSVPPANILPDGCPYAQTLPPEVNGEPEYNIKLPCKAGERVRIYAEGRWQNSYISAITQDQKGRWWLEVGKDKQCRLEQWGEIVRRINANGNDN